MNIFLVILAVYALVVHVMWGVVCCRSLSKQVWYSDARRFWLAVFNALPVVIVFSMISSAIKGDKP